MANFEIVVAETAPGGDFEGFRPSSRTDVLALAQSAGIDTGTREFSVNDTSTRKLIDLLGMTLFSVGGSTGAFGLIEQFSGFPNDPSNQLVAIFDHLPPFDRAGILFVPYVDVGERPFEFTGVMLYRQVPEPSGIILALFSLLALCTARRFRV